MNWKVFCASLALAAMMVSAPRAASAGSVNLNFEGGTLAGWTVDVPPGGAASVVSSMPKLGESGTWTAPQGNSFAYLRTDGDGSYTMLSKTFYSDAGHTLCFDVFFDAGDYYPHNDRGLVVLWDQNGFHQELYDKDVARVGDYGSDGWTHVSYVIPKAGTFTLDFQVANLGRVRPGGEDLYYSAMGIDNVSVAPLPASVWGGLSLLTALGAVRAWRRSRA